MLFYVIVILGCIDIVLGIKILWTVNSPASNDVKVRTYKMVKGAAFILTGCCIILTYILKQQLKEKVFFFLLGGVIGLVVELYAEAKLRQCKSKPENSNE